MRFVRFRERTDLVATPVLGAIVGDRIVRISDLVADPPITSLEAVRRRVEITDSLNRRTATSFAPADIRLAAPLEPRVVMGTGTNYRDHVLEMGVQAQGAPTANFTKLPDSLANPGDDIVLRPGAFVDYEGEIAVIVGEYAHNITEGEVDAYLAGACLANDVTARDAPTTQLTLAKSAPGFCPLGPALVTLDELDIGAIDLVVTVNGETRQIANTADMIHPIRTVVASYARALPLEPGDVILTGSPAGVGVARKPPIALRHGDVVAISSPQLGTLVNRFVATASVDLG